MTEHKHPALILGVLILMSFASVIGASARFLMLNGSDNSGLIWIVCASIFIILLMIGSSLD